ncbi:MAG: putative 3-5 exonuclease related to the exonuclease domain of PolB [Planctomycetaceae bacterium]|nr:putative 3-5 exonuclease related to the exonuclease domain of PolB [Planctomycetaceae bacterium]
MDPQPKPEYLIFDTEAIADGDLIAKIRYPKEKLDANSAIARYRSELVAERGDGKDFIPHTFMLPISVAIGKVDAQFRLTDLTVLDAPAFRPHVITRKFWQGWSHYNRPTLVTFNGRGYDIPLLELAAFRYGYSLPYWFNYDDKSFEQARNRFNLQSHLDLYDLISNFGAVRMTGGLNLLANLIGKPGKTEVDGSKVQDMYLDGKVQEINDYCRCDVLDTYFVFLRSRVLIGKLKLEEEQELVEEAHGWLEKQSENIPVYAHYLSNWGSWTAPEDV